MTLHGGGRRRADDGPGPGPGRAGAPRRARGPARWTPRPPSSPTGWSATAPDAALLEVTWRRPRADARDAGVWVAVTGAPGPGRRGRRTARRRPRRVAARRAAGCGWARRSTGVRVLPRRRRRHRRRPGARLAVHRHARLGRSAPGRGRRRRCRSGAPTGPPAPLDTPRPPVPGPLRVWPGRGPTGSPPTRSTRLCATPYVVGRRLQPGRPAPRRASRRCGCGTTSCRARGWCSGRCRCRRAASRWCSWPTTRRRAATRCSPSSHPDDLWQCAPAAAGGGAAVRLRGS